MIRTIFVALMVSFLLSLMGNASDFSLFRDEKGHWIIEFIDEEHPRDPHTINIILNGRIWKKEVVASNKTQFNTQIDSDERPSVDIEEYE